MKNIYELQCIVDSLEEWVCVMAQLATCPRPYTRMDRYMITTADQKIERQRFSRPLSKSHLTNSCERR